MAVESLKRVPDANAVYKWRWHYPYAYGPKAPLRFRLIRYSDKTPTSAVGLGFRLVIKTAAGGTVILDDSTVSNFDLSSDPLLVGYVLDTTLEGFEPGGTYPGELYVTDPDADIAEQLVNEFEIALGAPI